MSDTDTISTGTERTIEQWWSQYREKLDSSDELRVEVYFRSLAPPPGGHTNRRQLLGKIRNASDAERIGHVETTVLGEEICLCDQCRKEASDENIIETVTRLRNWRGGGIASTGFTERNVSSSIAEEEYRAIVPPETSLGIYVEDSLVGVFPCTADGVTYGPDAFFKRLVSEHRAEPEQQERGPLSAVDD